ncbi:MAG: galactose oxidase-like domain-containing protein [Myxococcota bacterium]
MLVLWLAALLSAPVQAHDDEPYLAAGAGGGGQQGGSEEENPPPASCNPSGPFGLPGVTMPYDEVGIWGPVDDWPARATHAALVHTGKVLWWRSGLDYQTQLYDPVTNTNTMVAPPPGAGNLLCPGHVTLDDGRVIAMGGSGGNPSNAATLAIVFDPTTESWTRVTDMHETRWYPTAKALPDGRVLVMSGQQSGIRYADTPEVYEPDTDTWTLLHPAKIHVPSYPFIFVLPTGRLTYAGNVAASMIQDFVLPTWELDLQTQRWSYLTASVTSANRGSAAMYRPSKILKVGGQNPATNESEIIDLSQPAPQWTRAADLIFPRRRGDLVLLPDGNVLLIGGTTADQQDPDCAVHAAELWDPDTDTWTQMASMVTPRMYHSSAMLLPDGRVLAAGGDNEDLPVDGEHSAEIFWPPYLFRGARPGITGGPSSGVYGTTVSIQTPDAASVASAALMRPAAVTHNFDQNQMYVPVSFTDTGSALDVTLPPDANTAPPGYYMLFLVNGAGVPSEAHWIRLEPPACPASPDTDGDGHPDCDDNCPALANGAAQAGIVGVGDQLDTDGDAMGDACDPDDDNDLLADGVETGTGVFVSVSDTGTDPRAYHSDADGLGDGDEVLIHGSSPHLVDTDADSLADDDEVEKYGTDPTLADSDGDGLEDPAEAISFPTDPMDPDSDDDGLLDGEEMLIYATDPLDPDSDDDGFSDGIEVAANSNPLWDGDIPTVPLPLWATAALGAVLLAGARATRTLR